MKQTKNHFLLDAIKQENRGGGRGKSCKVLDFRTKEPTANIPTWGWRGEKEPHGTPFLLEAAAVNVLEKGNEQE